MPFGPFKKKKKKKDTLNLPSFFENEEKSLLQKELHLAGSPRTTDIQKPPKTTELPEPPRTTDFQKSPKTTELAGPPRTTELRGPPKTTELAEPPRKSEFREPPPPSLRAHPNLPPPPELSAKQPPQPFTGPGEPIKTTAPLFGSETVTDEILDELKHRSFGSGLEKAPTKRIERKTADELAKRHFQETKKNYVEAGKKHLELNFHDNAAVNFACAILCDLIAEDVETARRTMSQLSTNMPSTVMDNVIFESVRLIVEATRTKNHSFLTRVEKTLQSSMGQLYPEDIAIIERGLTAARKALGLE